MFLEKDYLNIWAKLKGVKYQFIYHKWLSEGMLTDDELFEKVANKRMSYKDASKKHKKDGGGPKKVKIADYYIDDEVGQRAKATPTAIILSKPSDDEELVKVKYTNGFIDYVPQDVIEVLPFAKGGEVKKKGNEMIMGGLAGVILGIFLNK